MFSFRGRGVKRLWYVFTGAMLFLLFFIFIISINLFGLFGKIPALEVLENPRSDLASEVYSEDYKLLGKYFLYNRTQTEYHELAPELIRALIATEDVRFYSHSGVDMKGTFAIFYYALTLQKRGSSTLSQQLAKNLFRMRDSEEYRGALSRFMPVVKIKEIITAIRLERSYTKEEIISMYLNTVEFGNGTYGIKGAARTYFNTTPQKLKLEEAAMLVGLLKGPAVYDPRTRPERALNRRNTVLSQMVKYEYLTDAAYQQIKNNEVKLDFTFENQNTGLAPHFREYIKPFLKKWCEEHGYNLYRDGLRIHTTVNSRMQQYAEQAVSRHMKELQQAFFAHWKGRAPWTDGEFKEIPGFVESLAKKTGRYKQLKEEFGKDEASVMKLMNTRVKMRVFTWNGDKDTTLSPVDSIRYYLHILHTGFVSMEPRTGKVKAWVGDINFRYFKYDHVKQGSRQPGSSFKPLLYAYAIEERGFTPCTKVLDVEVPFRLPNGNVWKARNSNNIFSNEYFTLRQALARSINTVSAYLIKTCGPDSVAAFARRMGITTRLDPVPSLSLGTSDVSVYDLVNAYTIFVNHGYRHFNSHELLQGMPVCITKIEDKHGNVLEEFSAVSRQVLSAETSALMVHMLKGATEETGGTGKDLREKFNLPYPIGGKTGTTQSSSDGWFIGITPDLVSGIWVGGEDRRIRFRDMSYGQGARMALPVWAYYMQKVYGDRELNISKEDFPLPEGVEIEAECPEEEQKGQPFPEY